MDWRSVYSRQRAEDVFLFHCYLYYCLASPRMTDAEFDQMHKWFLALYPESPVLQSVGSDNPESYPAYIREFRRPLTHEKQPA